MTKVRFENTLKKGKHITCVCDEPELINVNKKVFVNGVENLWIREKHGHCTRCDLPEDPFQEFMRKVVESKRK